jgi:hypothetical protein
MPVVLPSHPDVIEQRLASLEDPTLAQRLLHEHPELYPPEPPTSERQVLAWATRRFGTVALAVTAAISIAAGYVFTPLLTRHAAPPQPASHAAVKAAPAAHAAAQQHRVAVPAAAAHVAHHAAPAAPKHTAVAAPVTHRAAIVHPRPVAVIHPAPIIHPARIVHHAPAPTREELALRYRLRAQEAQLARLRKQAAAEEEAARAAQARAAEAASGARSQTATRNAPAPQPQPRTQSPTSVSTATSTAAGEATAAAPAPVDEPVTTPNGTKSAPSAGQIWSEHPMGANAPGPLGVPVDPCTPRGGRIGGVLNSLVGSALGGRSSFRI